MERAEETLKRIATTTSTNSENDAKLTTSAKTMPGDPNCPHCHGVGYLREEVPVGHANFGKLSVCSCRLEEVQEAKKDRQKQLSSLGGLSTKTFENFEPKSHASDPNRYPSLHRALSEARKFADRPSGWIIFHWRYGSGKTHLAAAIANASIERGQSVIFVNTPDLLDHLRITFAPNSEITFDDLFDRVRNIPLLIIDDIGAESPTSWANEKLYQILNHRYTLNLPTVITTNKEFEEFDPRIRSRLEDTPLVKRILLEAPDYRRPESDSLDISSLNQHLNQTFESFDARKDAIPPEQQRLLMKAYDEAQDYAQEPNGWIVFTGGHGCGKTHLAAAIANHCNRSRPQVLFVTVSDLLDHLRATFSPDSTVRYYKRFMDVKSAPFLVFDYLAIESATKWAREKLMQLIDYRYISRLPTVITTAVAPADMDDWFATRLLDERFVEVCRINAPIYKGGKGAGKRGKGRQGNK